MLHSPHALCYGATYDSHSAVSGVLQNDAHCALGDVDLLDRVHVRSVRVPDHRVQAGRGHVPLDRGGQVKLRVGAAVQAVVHKRPADLVGFLHQLGDRGVDARGVDRGHVHREALDDFVVLVFEIGVDARPSVATYTWIITHSNPSIHRF